MILRILTTLCFFLVSVLFLSCDGSKPPDGPVDPGPDTTPPTASLSNPSDGSIIGDSVTIIVDAADNVGVSFVEFYLDGSHVPGATDSLAPFQYHWDASSLILSSAHVIIARVYDAADNSKTTTPITVYSKMKDPDAPLVSQFAYPPDSSVIGNSVLVQVAASSGAGISRVQFFVNGTAPVLNGIDSIAPYEYTWNTMNHPLASANLLSTITTDLAGKKDTSESLVLFAEWRMMISDDDSALPRDLSALYIRSTLTNKLQFRVEIKPGWGQYKDTATGIDVALFFDTDRNAGTGAFTVAGGTIPINDIGADYRAVVGFHGDVVDQFSGTWGFIRNIAPLSVPNNGNAFEFSLLLLDLGNPAAIDIVGANVNLIANPDTWDWAPNQGAGHVTYFVDKKYISQ
ncbi:MAG: Ig-like domain-containing protein [candidate division Zixibacteria bacterium]|nr:Ig-like domain-containing protein [candidate division Zixibacteria bacterium]